MCDKYIVEVFNMSAAKKRMILYAFYTLIS